MIIKIAEEHDLAHIMLAGREFFKESNWFDNMTLCDKTIRLTLLAMHNDPNSIVIVAYDDECDVAGFALWGLQNPWTVEKIAIEDLFYIRKSARKSKIAQAMLDFSIKACQDRGAKLLYSSSTAGFNDDGKNARAYNLLLRRKGFKELPQSRFLIHTMEV